MTRARRIALILFLIVDVGYVLWGGMAAAWPQHLLGPHGVPIVPAGYEGFTGESWAALLGSSPRTAQYIEVVFRMYGVYNAVFGFMAIAIAVIGFRRAEPWAWWALFVGNTIALVSAMTYDRTVHAIGPFEVSEYVGLALVFSALALTAPFLRARPRSAAELTPAGRV